MSVKDLKGNEVSRSSEALPGKGLLFLVVAIVVVILGYRIYDCATFNHLNRQRLRSLENFGAAAMLRDGRRGWRLPWLVKDNSPVKLIFFDHPRFKESTLTEKDVARLVQLIGGLPNVPSVHVARKSMSPEIVKQLEDRLGSVKFTSEQR